MIAVCLTAFAIAIGFGCGDDFDCDGTLRQYHSLLRDAQTCDPSAATNECTQSTESFLLCSCSTWVNATFADLDRLRKLSADFARNCPGQCPKDGGACRSPTPSSACDSSSNACTF
jgi:hypothetical protein